MPRVIPIAYDGLAIIVNNANPDTCITVKDFARILSGEVTNWKDIYPNSKLGEIDVVFDNPKSSTVTWCVDSILGGKPINSKNIGAVKKSAEVIDWVEKHENAIGIIGSNWLNDKRDTTNVTFKKNITVMKVSKMDSATPETAGDPISTTYIMATIRSSAPSMPCSTSRAQVCPRILPISAVCPRDRPSSSVPDCCPFRPT